MQKITLRSCLCGCCSLKRGGQIWGMIHMSFCFCILIMAIIYMIHTDENQNILIFTPALISSIIYLVFDFLLLVGFTRRVLNLVLSWLIWNGCIALCLLWYLALVLICLIFVQPLLMLGTIPPILYLCIELYFVVVVLSYYIERKYPPGTVLYNPPVRRYRPAQEDYPDSRPSRPPPPPPDQQQDPPPQDENK